MKLMIVCLAASAAATWPLSVGFEAQAPTPAIGMSRVEILEECGRPVRVGGGPACLELEYRGASGEPVRIYLHEDVAVFIAPPRPVFADTKPIPEAGAYPGQSVAELVAELGPPDEISTGASRMDLVYPDKKIQIAHGVVLEVGD